MPSFATAYARRFVVPQSTHISFNGLSGSPDTRLAQGGFVGELEPEFAQRLIGSVAYHQVRLGRIKVS